jgi:hypothetical protein
LTLSTSLLSLRISTSGSLVSFTGLFVRMERVSRVVIWTFSVLFRSVVWEWPLSPFDRLGGPDIEGCLEPGWGPLLAESTCCDDRVVRVLCRTGAAVRVLVCFSAVSVEWLVGIPRRGRSDGGALCGSVREDISSGRPLAQEPRLIRIRTHATWLSVCIFIFGCGRLLSGKAQARAGRVSNSVPVSSVSYPHPCTPCRVALDTSPAAASSVT